MSGATAILLAVILLAANCVAQQTSDCQPIPTINNGVCIGKDGIDCSDEQFRSSPKLCEAPDPQYTAEAAKAKIKGTVILRVTLGTDGCAHDIHVVRRLGYGLDEAAVFALERFRWQKRNKPTPASIEMNFDPQAASTRPVTTSKCVDISSRSTSPQSVKR